jgi:hypothetical protein
MNIPTVAFGQGFFGTNNRPAASNSFVSPINTSNGMPIVSEKKDNWIQAMHMKKGALHKQMGVPKSENIPKGELKAAAKKGGKLGKRARLAQTLSKFGK